MTGIKRRVKTLEQKMGMDQQGIVEISIIHHPIKSECNALEDLSLCPEYMKVKQDPIASTNTKVNLNSIVIFNCGDCPGLKGNK